MTDPEPYDHVRVGDDGPIAPGVYRVVGTGDNIALLRVGDRDGRRETTGEVVRVARSTFDTFEAANNPDAGFSLGDFVPPVRTYAKAIRYWLPV